jgi:phenylpyruvate tautomerase PptA (4-oxalocrotonate tautomerase family)
MPIVEIEVVRQSNTEPSTVEVHSLANGLGEVFHSAPGHTWAKVRYLNSTSYAENGSDAPGSELPVFVSVLHAHLPQAEAIATEAKAVTLAVAKCLGRAPEFVHVRYEPSAAGRQAFGGTLVR